ncbi:nucleotidyltransferase family protein [Streptomyces sp. NPDC006678]|uniref:nucleotidyltransferase family protein n=1 Tax=Streptomyces sp. NPDC006678 TaxID=3157185 RepID=UPI0033F79D71
MAHTSEARDGAGRLHLAGAAGGPTHAAGGSAAHGAAHGQAHGATDDLPKDHTQAILETTKQVAALLKEAGCPFALAGSVAAHAHGVPAVLQHDTDFCIRREDVDEVVGTLGDGGIEIVAAPEDWLVKARAGGEQIDLIFELSHRRVTDELLARATVLPVDSVRMPVLAPYDLLSSRLAALTEQHCDFGPVLTIARTLRERIDWGTLRAEHRDEPFAEAFLCLLERLGVIESYEPQKGGT